MSVLCEVLHLHGTCYVEEHKSSRQDMQFTKRLFALHTSRAARRGSFVLQMQVFVMYVVDQRLNEQCKIELLQNGDFAKIANRDISVAFWTFQWLLLKTNANQ